MRTVPRSSDRESDSSEVSELASLLRALAHAPEVDPESIEPDRRGQEIAHFRVDAKLGQGGMGVVYAAEDLRLGRRVAIKLLPRPLVADEERRRRFLREARAASAVSHPNVATVFEIGEADGTIFIAMEYVEGVTLRTLLRQRGGRLAWVDAVRIAREVASALARAHAAGVVHRDLKPENIMITREGGVKLLDFGVAKLVDAPDGSFAAGPPPDAGELASRLGRLVGTPGYMSPEQARGHAVDARSDVFSLGVVLHEMVRGARPFAATTPEELLEVLKRGPAPDVGTVPRALSRVIARCLLEEPALRFADGGALAVALEGASADTARGVWLRRGALGMGAALVLVATAWGVSMAVRASPTVVPAGVRGSPSAECPRGGDFGAPMRLDWSSERREGQLRFSPLEDRAYFWREAPVGAQPSGLFAVTREGDRWSAAAPIFPSPEGEYYSPTVTADGLRLAFEDGRDVLLAVRPAEGAPFAIVGPLASDPAADDVVPYLRPDGAALYFASTRGPMRSFDLYRAAVDGDRAALAVALDELNTPKEDWAPVVRSDDLEIFWSSARRDLGTAGGWDLFTATRGAVSEPFSTVRHLAALSSPLAEHASWISPDGCRLYLWSDRGGDLDLYLATR